MKWFKQNQAVITLAFAGACAVLGFWNRLNQEEAAQKQEIAILQDRVKVLDRDLTRLLESYYGF